MKSSARLEQADRKKPRRFHFFSFFRPVETRSLLSLRQRPPHAPFPLPPPLESLDRVCLYGVRGKDARRCFSSLRRRPEGMKAPDSKRRRRRGDDRMWSHPFFPASRSQGKRSKRAPSPSTGASTLSPLSLHGLFEEIFPREGFERQHGGNLSWTSQQKKKLGLDLDSPTTTTTTNSLLLPDPSSARRPSSSSPTPSRPRPTRSSSRTRA